MNTNDEETENCNKELEVDFVDCEEKRENNVSTQTPSTQKVGDEVVNGDIDNHDMNSDSKHKFACNKTLYKPNVDNQMSLDSILGLVDEIESQVEHFREKVQRLEDEKSSLQSTIQFIAQMLSQSCDRSIKSSTVLATSNKITQNGGKIFCNTVWLIVFYNDFCKDWHHAFLPNI